MASLHETGHARNVAHFQTLIEFVKSYSNAYNPSKPSLQLPALQELKASADSTLQEVLAKNTIYNTKINERLNAFINLKSLSTRLINAIQATDATPGIINDAKAYNRKIQGKKAKTPKATDTSDKETAKTISTSQQSYDQQIQHLVGLKNVLEAEPSYSPNEDDLKITTLNRKIIDLQEKNTAVATAYTAVSTSRIKRNQTLYTGENGIFETAKDVKKYIKSVFGATSPQFLQVKGLPFKKPRLS
ncbi:hypothetical protein [Chryseobacterium sp. Mn2064]|uniref:hypothetical protein n=1 Tax=Chryseobacterium sp. Mn2064 TaxID=3395263 RepID=UPI003BDCD914